MKHLKKKRTLGRERKQYRALMFGLADSLFIHKKIETSLAKAKELRPLAERFITKAREKNLNKIRLSNKKLSRKAAVELFEKIGPKCRKRAGGYLRIIKIINRKSDNSKRAIIELVDFSEEKEKEKEKPKKEEVKVNKKEKKI